MRPIKSKSPPKLGQSRKMMQQKIIEQNDEYNKKMKKLMQPLRLSQASRGSRDENISASPVRN